MSGRAFPTCRSYLIMTAGMLQSRRVCVNSLRFALRVHRLGVNAFLW